MEAVSDPRLEAAFVKVDDALVELRGVGVVPVDARDAIRVVRRLEHVARVVYGLQAGLVGEIDRRGLHRADGHKSVRAMVGWAADLSAGDATKRARAARVLRDMPSVAAAVAAGSISVSALDRIGVTHANTRVRDQLVASEDHLAVVAGAISYGHFHQYLKHWEAMADADGLRDKAERDHERRDFSVRQNLDGSFRFEGGCGSVQGTVTLAIFQAYVTAEFEADLAEARARLGDGASLDDLCRTDKQRRMDALAVIFDDAVSARGERTGQQVITNLVIDHETLDRYAKTFTGEPLDPDPRLESWWQDLAAKHGTRDDDTDAGKNESEVDGDVEAWAGCNAPASTCQADHLLPWAHPDKGRTDPGNGAPTCGKHNRFRNHGFTVHRDDDGTLHVHRPDGTRIK